MKLQFVPVEEFYFALTLCCRTLEDIDDPSLVAQVHQKLKAKFGQSSTVAAGKQNSFNYTFQVINRESEGVDPLVISISDWQDKLRISSDFGWTLNPERKPKRTEKFDQREAFCKELKELLNRDLNLSLPV